MIAGNFSELKLAVLEKAVATAVLLVQLTLSRVLEQ